MPCSCPLRKPRRPLWPGIPCAVLVIVCLVPVCLAGDYYTWTDQGGQVHISTEPPPEGACDIRERSFENRKTSPETTPAVSTGSPVRKPSTERTVEIDPESVKIERDRLQAEITRLERDKLKSTAQLGIKDNDRDGYEKLRKHRETCDRKIAELDRRLGELRRDPLRYAKKYHVILY